MDFTREPVIQSVITPRQGYRLVVRSSKSAGLEEHFVDAVEIVSFGDSAFFRSTERPKPFIVPVSDHEVLEVREPRIVLKAPAQGSIKVSAAEKIRVKQEPEKAKEEATTEARSGRPREREEARGDKRRDRRRGTRRRRGQSKEEQMQEGAEALEGQKIEGQESFTEFTDTEFQVEGENILTTAPMLSTILPPPTTLIRDNLERLRKHEAYRDAFYDVEKGEDEKMPFPTESVEYTESEISMKEGGDEEVPQKVPFRQQEEHEQGLADEQEGVLQEGVSDAKANAE